MRPKSISPNCIPENRLCCWQKTKPVSSHEWSGPSMQVSVPQSVHVRCMFQTCATMKEALAPTIAAKTIASSKTNTANWGSASNTDKKMQMFDKRWFCLWSILLFVTFAKQACPEVQTWVRLSCFLCPSHDISTPRCLFHCTDCANILSQLCDATVPTWDQNHRCNEIYAWKAGFVQSSWWRKAENKHFQFQQFKNSLHSEIRRNTRCVRCLCVETGFGHERSLKRTRQRSRSRSSSFARSMLVTRKRLLQLDPESSSCCGCSRWTCVGSAISLFCLQERNDRAQSQSCVVPAYESSFTQDSRLNIGENQSNLGSGQFKQGTW